MSCKSEQPKKKQKRIGNAFHNFVKLSGGLGWLLWMRPKVYYYGGKRKKFKGKLMIFSNHPHAYDPVLIHGVFWYRNLYSLATIDLFRNKPLHWFMTHIHCIPVNKENFSMNSLHDTLDALSQNKAVLIFPEGGINDDRQNMKAFKSGVVLIAHRADAPILPVYVVPRTKKHERYRLVIGEPLSIKEMCGERPTLKDFDKVSATLKEKELELERFYQQKTSKKTKRG